MDDMRDPIFQDDTRKGVLLLNITVHKAAIDSQLPIWLYIGSHHRARMPV